MASMDIIYSADQKFFQGHCANSLRKHTLPKIGYVAGCSTCLLPIVDLPPLTPCDEEVIGENAVIASFSTPAISVDYSIFPQLGAVPANGSNGYAMTDRVQHTNQVSPPKTFYSNLNIGSDMLPRAVINELANQSYLKPVSTVNDFLGSASQHNCGFWEIYSNSGEIEAIDAVAASGLAHTQAPTDFPMFPGVFGGAHVEEASLAHDGSQVTNFIVSASVPKVGGVPQWNDPSASYKIRVTYARIHKQWVYGSLTSSDTTHATSPTGNTAGDGVSAFTVGALVWYEFETNDRNLFLYGGVRDFTLTRVAVPLGSAKDGMNPGNPAASQELDLVTYGATYAENSARGPINAPHPTEWIPGASTDAYRWATALDAPMTLDVSFANV